MTHQRANTRGARAPLAGVPLAALILLAACSADAGGRETSATDTPDIPVIRAFLGERAEGPHPDAPAELAQFGQLAGLWRCEQEMRRRDSSWAGVGEALWAWRYTPGGYAVQDLWYQAEADLPEYLGDLGRDYLLTALRMYDVRSGAWHVAWASNGQGQTPGDDHGTSTARWEDGRIVMLAPPADFGLQRIVFDNITPTSFDWVSEFSQDEGRTWNAIMRIHATRIR